MLEKEPMQVKAGMERAKLPEAEQRLELECYDWVGDVIGEGQVDELCAWAEMMAMRRPGWTV